jgi:cleavage and polyadenylation specificity factor subunit 2
MKRKVILQGLELEDYLEAERIAAELEAKREALLERSRRMMQEDAESDSDSDADGSDTEVAAPTQDSKMDGTGARRRFGGFTGGAGAWDEFLDPLSLQGSSGQSFDVYVEGAYSKRVGGEGREAMGRFRMFPVVERKRRVDVYGEAIDVEGWLRRGVEDQSFKPVIAPVAVVKRVREEDEEVQVSIVAEDDCVDTDVEG